MLFQNHFTIAEMRSKIKLFTILVKPAPFLTKSTHPTLLFEKQCKYSDILRKLLQHGRQDFSRGEGVNSASCRGSGGSQPPDAGKFKRFITKYR